MIVIYHLYNIYVNCKISNRNIFIGICETTSSRTCWYPQKAMYDRDFTGGYTGFGKKNRSNKKSSMYEI